MMSKKPVKETALTYFCPMWRRQTAVNSMIGGFLICQICSTHGSCVVPQDNTGRTVYLDTTPEQARNGI